MKTIYCLRPDYWNQSGIIHASEDGKHALCGQEPSGENSEFCDLSDPYYRQGISFDPDVVTCKRCLKYAKKRGIVLKGV